MRHVWGMLLFLIAMQSFGQRPLNIQEIKQPGDSVRILVHFDRAPGLKSATAILERETSAGECHLPQIAPLESKIVCSTVEKINGTEYLFSGTVENNATGWYKLTKIVDNHGGKKTENLWGHDFDSIVRMLVRNPQEKQCVQAPD